MSRTLSAVIAPSSSWAIAWSSSDSASRTEPSAARAISASALGFDVRPSRCRRLPAKCSTSSPVSMRRRSKRWQRDSTVTGTLRISVVAKMNFTCGGGSSSVFSRRVERLLRQHVHFVDDVDLVARAGRCIAHAVDDLADVVDAGARGGVHLQDVDMARSRRWPRRDRRRRTGGWSGRRLAVGPDAVEGAGEDARGGGLADAAHAGEHEGVGDAAGGEGVRQRPHHRLLPDQAGEILRPVFARQHAIGFGPRGSRWRIEAKARAKIGSFRVVHGGTIASARARARGFLWTRGGRRQRPAANSLRLLPSGPDRVGECCVRHRLPGPI